MLSTNPDEASTTGHTAAEARSESRESRAPRAFWIPQFVFEHYQSGGSRVAGLLGFDLDGVGAVVVVLGGSLQCPLGADLD